MSGPGTVTVDLIGSYRVGPILGEGSFGRVYSGHHALLGPDVPVCIKQEKMRIEPFKTVFREEALLLARGGGLRHPGLPSFLDYLEIRGLGQFLVMSFIKGTPLDKLLKDHGPVVDEHCCWILDRILDPLDHLHSRWRIIHGDVKPANILLDIPEHHATLVDLGLANDHPVFDSKARGGTPGFVPPEFAARLPPIPASDLYSVGKVGLALVGGDVEKGTIPDDVHPLLRDLLARLIRRDAMARPQSALPLRDELLDIRRKAWGRITTPEPIRYRRTS